MNESPKVDVPAPKLVAFIGCLVMICEGILFILAALSMANPVAIAMYLIAGISNLAAGTILFLVINVIDLKFDIKIPYVWWLLLAIGAGIIIIDFLAYNVAFGGVFGATLYIGGLLVGLGGLLEWHVIPEKIGISDSKFVLLVGSAMAIVVSIITRGFASGWTYVAIALCVLLILAIFDVAIPYEWWLTLGVAIAILMLIHPASGVVLLVGYLLVQLDY